MAGGYPESHVWFKYNFFFHWIQRSCTCFQKMVRFIKFIIWIKFDLKGGAKATTSSKWYVIWISTVPTRLECLQFLEKLRFCIRNPHTESSSFKLKTYAERKENSKIRIGLPQNMGNNILDAKSTSCKLGLSRNIK